MSQETHTHRVFTFEMAGVHSDHQQVHSPEYKKKFPYQVTLRFNKGTMIDDKLLIKDEDWVFVFQTEGSAKNLRAMLAMLNRNKSNCHILGSVFKEVTTLVEKDLL